MDAGEHSLALLGAVLLLGLLAPILLRRFHLPLASSLLIAGAAAGPHGFGLVEPDATLTTFAFLGATFQMFLAGLEAHQLDLRLADRNNALLALHNGLLPAVLGAGLTLAFGYGGLEAAFVGAAFASSSILLLFATVRHHGLGASELGRRLQSLAVTLDLGSAFAVFILLKYVEPHARFPLPILLGLVVLSVSALRMYVPELAEFVFSRLERTASTGEERRARFVVALMLLVVFAYAALDVPAVVAAFLAGFALAPVPHATELREKLHLVGHALFIPVFLFAVGLETDPGVLVGWDPTNLLVVLLVLVAVGGKVAGGYTGGRRIGLPDRDASFLGIASSARLAISVTVTYAGFKAGLVDATLLTAVVLVAVGSSILAPLVLALPRFRRGGEG